MNKRILIAMFCMILIVLTPIAFGQLNTTVANGGPAIAVEIPEYVDDDEITIIGGTAAGAIVELWVNGQLRRKAEIEDGNINFAYVDLLANEANIIIIRATDATGTNEREYIVFSDLLAPVIEITSVIPEIASRNTILLRGTVSEVVDFEVAVNGLTAFSQEDLKVFSINISLEEGTNEITINATDKAGHTRKITESVAVDTTPPTIENIKPRRDAFYYEGRAVDNIEGLTEPFAEVTLYYEYEAVVKEETKRTKIAETTADASGYFEFERIDFEHPAPGITLREVKPGELVSEIEQQSIKAARFILKAVDLVGLSVEEEVRVSIGTCWSGWPIFDINLLPQYQMPSLMSPERLKEGTEVMSFILNLTYAGSAKEWKIMDIYIDPACGRSAGSLAEEYQDDLRYEVACSLLQRGRPSMQHNKAKTLWYVEYTNLRAEDYANFSEDFWEQFTQHELIFPLKLRIGYQEKQPDGKWSPTQYQVKCFPVSYFVDIPIDPRKVLPDWLVEGGIDFANKTVETLDKIIPQVIQARDIVGAACIGSWAVRWAVKIYRMFACNFLDQMMPGGEDNEKACPPEEPEEEGGLSRLSLTDKQLEARCPSCSGAWEAEAALYQVYRWTCDRIFCHKVPSSWTEKATDVEIFKAEEKARLCEGDEIAGVLPLQLVKNCWKVYEDKLEKQYVDNKQKNCYKYGAGETAALYVYRGKIEPSPVIEGKEVEIYRLVKASTGRDIIGERAPPPELKAVKSGNQYATATVYSCEELCKMTYHTNVTAKCVDAKECTKKDGTYEGHVAGYSQKNCWFDVHGGFDMSQQCCCYVEKKPAEEEKPSEGESKDWSYRQQQLYVETDKEHGTKYRTDKYIPERDRPGCFGQQHLRDYISPAGEKMVPMVDPFSQHTSAFQCLCLTGIIGRLQLLKQIFIGMANCLQQIKTTGEADAGVCKELFSQYVCDLIYQLFVQVSKGCIVLPWGSELDLGGGAKTGSVSESIEAPGLGEAFKVGFGSIFKASEQAASDLSAEYGNTTLTNFLSGGEQQISKKICLAAFGFDVGFDFKSLMEMSYQSQFKSSVSAFGARRTYLTYNPATAIPTYEYRTAWTIFPGCDIKDYTIDLTCVSAAEESQYNGIDCSAIGDVQSGEAPKGCNCLYSDKPYGERSRKFFVSPTGVDAGIFEDKDHHMIIDDSPVRFDHLRVKINLESGYDPEKCFPDGYKDGVFYFPIADKTARDLVDCFVDQRGLIRCTRGLEWESQGQAWFMPFSIADCGGGQECYMLCQHPEERNKWLDCRLVNYELRDNVNVKFRVQGTEQQCIYAYLENAAGKKIGDPLKATQGIGEPTIEGDYLTQALYRFGTVEDRDFSAVGRYNINMTEGGCVYDKISLWDSPKYLFGNYPVEFVENISAPGKYIIDVPSGVEITLNNNTIDDKKAYHPADIYKMKFVIGGFGIRINKIPGKGTCLFKVIKEAGESERWKVHAELRYPDFAGRCGPDSTIKVEPVVGELNEIEERIDIFEKAEVPVKLEEIEKAAAATTAGLLSQLVTMKFTNTALINAFDTIHSNYGLEIDYSALGDPIKDPILRTPLTLSVTNEPLSELLKKMNVNYAEVKGAAKPTIKVISVSTPAPPGPANACTENNGQCLASCVGTGLVAATELGPVCPSGYTCCVPVKTTLPEGAEGPKPEIVAWFMFARETGFEPDWFIFDEYESFTVGAVTENMGPGMKVIVKFIKDIDDEFKTTLNPFEGVSGGYTLDFPYGVLSWTPWKRLLPGIYDVFVCIEDAQGSYLYCRDGKMTIDDVEEITEVGECKPKEEGCAECVPLPEGHTSCEAGEIFGQEACGFNQMLCPSEIPTYVTSDIVESIRTGVPLR